MPDTGFGLSLHRNEFTGSRLKHGCFCLTMSGFVFESLGGRWVAARKRPGLHGRRKALSVAGFLLSLLGGL